MIYVFVILLWFYVIYWPQYFLVKSTDTCYINYMYNGFCKKKYFKYKLTWEILRFAQGSLCQWISSLGDLLIQVEI